jgi:hypothetical protein
LRRAGFCDFSVLQENQFLPQAARLSCIVGHKYDGDTVRIGFQDELLNGGGGGRIEACGRLVQKQNIRLASERADGGKALLFAA